MITVMIYYTGNDTGLSQLLVSLQPQLHPDDDIYVVDSTGGKSALKVVKAYGSTRCYLLVEPAEVKMDQAIEYVKEYCKDNRHETLLVLRDDFVISNTLISNIKRVAQSDFGIIYIESTMGLNGSMDPNFKWYYPPKGEVVSLELTPAFQGLNDPARIISLDKKPNAGIYTGETIVSVVPQTS